MTRPKDEDVVRAAGELREAIALKLGELASRLSGEAAPNSARWPLERAERSVDVGAGAEWHLTRLRIAREAGVETGAAVLGARRSGATWEQIGDACGITRQAAHERWARHVDDAIAAESQ